MLIRPVQAQLQLVTRRFDLGLHRTIRFSGNCQLPTNDIRIDVNNMTRTKSVRSRSRKGVETVELAVSLPLVIFILFASIEACECIFLQQAITEAAYQGALEGTSNNSTESRIIQRSQSLIDARGIQGASIVVTGAGGIVFDDLARGDSFSVSIQANIAANRRGPKLFAPNQDLIYTSTALK